MRLQRILAAVIVTALLLSGCASLGFGKSEILTPPKASGIRAEVQKLIETDAGGAYSLIYPTDGANKSGLFLHDVNNDGIEEAVALYTTADNTSRVLIAQQRDDAFRLLGSADIYSADVSELSFIDFDGNGREELLLGFAIGIRHAVLQTFLITDGVTTSNTEEGFVDYVTGDFDKDSSTDILLMMTPESASSAKARLLSLSEKGFSEKSSCEIDPAVISYTGLRFDKLNGDLYGAAADGKLGEGEYTTQLIYYDSAAKILVNPLYLNSNYKRTTRTSAVTCMDIDGDGAINIPLSSLMDHTKDEDTSTVCNVARWNDYDPEQMGLSFKKDAVLCEKLNFMLLFGTDKLKTVTARYSADNAVTLYNISYKNSEPVLGKEQLTVYRYDKASYDSSLTAQAQLYETAEYTYTYILSEDSGFSHDDIKDSFMLLSGDEKASSKK